MAKAWIRDRWLKSKAVVDGVELTPTTGMKRQVAANPDTADVPAALRTADYGRGMRWQVCWRADGRQHRESLPTREAAEARAAELNDDIRSGRYVDPRGGNRTLDEVFPLWLADHTGVRPATIDNYIRHYNGMVRPRFGSTRIGDIDERAVKAWVADLDSGAIRTKYGEPYTKGAIKTGVRRLLGSMLRYAVRRRWIMADPTAGVRLPRAPMQRVDAFTPAEARAIADAAGKLRTPTGRPCGRPMDRLVVLLLASTGMRPGEMAALDVRDVDLAHGTINVDKTMTKAEAGHYRYVQGDTKTPKGRRYRRSCATDWRNWSPAATAARPCSRRPAGSASSTPNGPNACSAPPWTPPASTPTGARSPSTPCATRSRPSPSHPAPTSRPSRSSWATRTRPSR